MWKQTNNYTSPNKPDKPEEQISTLWDFVVNHVHTQLNFQQRQINWLDVKLYFVLALLGVVIAFLVKLI